MYKNDWIFIQLCRGRQSWGFGEDIQIVISEESNNYDYFLMGFNSELYRPEDLLILNMPIPPVTIRPSLKTEYLSNIC